MSLTVVKVICYLKCFFRYYRENINISKIYQFNEKYQNVILHFKLESISWVVCNYLQGVLSSEQINHTVIIYGGKMNMNHLEVIQKVRFCEISITNIFLIFGIWYLKAYWIIVSKMNGRIRVNPCEYFQRLSAREVVEGRQITEF